MTRIHTAEPYIIDLELGTIDIQVYGKRKYEVPIQGWLKYGGFLKWGVMYCKEIEIDYDRLW